LDAWTVLDNKVYNLTPFIAMHPGGEKIFKAFGTDITHLWRKYKLWFLYLCFKVFWQKNFNILNISKDIYLM